ncbi:class III lanthionine synthetase LanKC [Luteococcus sp.]|uniref:class III lanthionine synthetase LanKC n=1 Tax=Luteococcus sp. TaxID=1969402 RepID=UPI0037360F9B
MAVRPEYILAANGDSPFYGTRKSMAQVLSRMGGESFQTEPLPPGWLMRRWGGWEGWTPRDWKPRIQGWKIHVSTTPACAVETLARVTRICVEREVSFKFLPEPANLLDSNGKQQDRGASGKFITIYPRDDEQFAELLVLLDEALAGQQGPYILSDLRYGDGPIYVRYGGIMSLSFPDGHDRPLSAIAAGPEMSLVKDRREPRFVVPEGVEMPACLVEAHHRYTSSTPSRLREFKAVSPLHFSNSGGVYKATLPDGTRHVLREARSNTGLDARGRDSVTRQLQEEEVLRDLSGVQGTQQLLGSFWAWEHRYLELEYAEGRPLTAWVVQNTPFEGRPEDRAAYAARATAVGRQVVDIVQRVHDAGWCIGDLHPGNILVSDDDQVTILDFEDATRADAPREIGFRVFEFCAPDSLDATQADWYAVSRSLMLMFVPDWEVEVIAPSFWKEALRRVEEQFGTQALELVREVEARFDPVDKHMLAPDLTVDTWPEPPALDVVVDALDAGLGWSRQFSATGSYPGDSAQAGDVSESLAFGRAGVVLARLRTGREVPVTDLDALAAAVNSSPAEPGLMAGQAGMALVLAEAGRLDAARQAARASLVESAARLRLDLFGGRAGVVLASLEVARACDDDDLLAEAMAANEHLQRTVVPGTSAWEGLTHRRGFHFGLTGLALVDLVAHLASGRRDVLDRAVERLRADVDACITTAAGDLMVRDVDNNRALPYVEWGSAGVWAVVQAAERLVGRSLLSDAEYAGMVHACSSDVYVYSSLDHGRAGIMALLACAGLDEEMARQRDFVLANLLRHETMAVHVGDGLVRLSADLSTGAAGTLLALHSAGSGECFDWMPVGRSTARFLSRLHRPSHDGQATAIAEPVAELEGTAASNVISLNEDRERIVADLVG